MIWFGFIWYDEKDGAGVYSETAAPNLVAWMPLHVPLVKTSAGLIMV